MCSAPKDGTPYMNQLQAGFVAFSGLLLFCVLVGLCLRLWFARQEARTLPIAGQRRSLVFSRKVRRPVGCLGTLGWPSDGPRMSVARVALVACDLLIFALPRAL